MTLELSIILGFLLHMIGDYVTQNHWIAINKTKDSYIAALHACIYSLPFLILFGCIPGDQFLGWIIILVTHFFIDRFRLVQYWIRLVNWNWDNKPSEAPIWLSTWILIIIDNVFHLIINTAAIILFY